MRFEFATASRIIFGTGTLKEIPSLIQGMGKKPFIAVDWSLDRAAPILNLLQEHDIEYETVIVRGEPTTDSILEGSSKAKDSDCDFVIGFGGGSVS